MSIPSWEWSKRCKQSCQKEGWFKDLASNRYQRKTIHQQSPFFMFQNCFLASFKPLPAFFPPPCFPIAAYACHDLVPRPCDCDHRGHRDHRGHHDHCGGLGLPEVVNLLFFPQVRSSTVKYKYGNTPVPLFMICIYPRVEKVNQTLSCQAVIP